MSQPRLEPWMWATILLLSVLVLWTITEVTSALWRAWRTPETQPPYDWQQDDRYLDELARDAEGEVLTVGHLLRWRYK